MRYRLADRVENYRQRDRETGWDTDRYINRHPGWQAQRQANIQADERINRQTDKRGSIRHTCWDVDNPERQTHTCTNKNTIWQTQRHIQTKTQSQRHDTFRQRYNPDIQRHSSRQTKKNQDSATVQRKNKTQRHNPNTPRTNPDTPKTHTLLHSLSQSCTPAPA